MSELVVIVPTRVRPHAVSAMLRAFADTTRAKTTLVFAIDGDPQALRYSAEIARGAQVYPPVVELVGIRRRLVGTLNAAVAEILEFSTPYALAYLGDDHRPETVGWDVAFLDALARLGSGFVYGDDGIQGENMPTAVAVTADIPAALGYLAPPCLTHMYLDNFWLDLGRGADAITYLPEVRISHRHFSTGATGMDASYAESNSAASYAADAAAYARFRAQGLLVRDIALLRELRATSAAQVREAAP